MKKFRKNIIRLLSTVIWLTSPAGVFADVLGDRLKEVGESTDEVTLVQSIMRFAVPLGIICVVGLTTYGGYLLITSQGDPERLSEAREIITNAIIGFVVVALAIAILALIQNVINLPGL